MSDDPLEHLHAVRRYHLAELARIDQLIKDHDGHGPLYHEQRLKKRQTLASFRRLLVAILMLMSPVMRDVMIGVWHLFVPSTVVVERKVVK